MLDQVKYEYIPLDLPNLLAQWERGKDRTDLKFEIEGGMKEFALRAAKEFPMWKFVASNNLGHYWGINTYHSEKRVVCKTFYIVQGTEQLGVIYIEHNRSGVRYALHNERIEGRRERGNADKTKSLDKAIKILSKFFSSKTLDERVDEAFGNCYYGLQRVDHEKKCAFFNDYSDLSTKLVDHVMSNWETTREVATSNGVPLTMLDSLPEKYENFAVSRKIKSCFDQGKGAVVVIHGNDYVVSNVVCVGSNQMREQSRMFNSDTLPAHLKRSVGMLKLVEPNHLVGNIGYKIDNNSFFVIGEET